MISLRQLEVLRAVMRLRTTLGAARELGMSQPGVSNAIKHMEAQLGFRLFARVKNRLEPTEEARILVLDAEPIFLMHREIRRKAMDLRSGRAGRIRILATSEVSVSLLPPMIAGFMQRYPDEKISLEVLSLDHVLEGVELGIGDVGFAMEPYPRPTIKCDSLVQLRMVCACPSGSVLMKLNTVTPRDLRNEKLIVAPPAGSKINKLISSAFDQVGERFCPAVEVRFMNVAARLVEEGVGAAIIDQLTAAAMRSSGLQVRSFKPRVQVAIYALSPADRPISRATGLFLEVARRELKDRVQMPFPN